MSEFAHLKKQFWGRHLWVRGYFCCSSGNVTDEVIAEYIANQNESQDGDFRVDGWVHLLLEARLVRASSCRPLAGTGLTARYKSHHLTGGGFHSRPALCLAAALLHETAKCPESRDQRDDPSSRHRGQQGVSSSLTIGYVYFLRFFLYAASAIL